MKPSLAYVWLGMNQEFPPFDNADVRRAIQHAIDVQGVLDAAYFGAVEAATGLSRPVSSGTVKRSSTATIRRRRASS